MTKPEIVSWLLSHGYRREDRFLAPDNEPGWEAYASKARGRVVIVCDTEAVFGSGLVWMQGLLEHVEIVPGEPEFLGLSGGERCTPFYRCRRSTFDAAPDARACAVGSEPLDKRPCLGSIATPAGDVQDGGPR